MNRHGPHQPARGPAIGPPRRLRTADLAVIVALAALPLAGIASVMRSGLPPQRLLDALGLFALALGSGGALWLVSRVAPRSVPWWAEIPLVGLYIAFCVAAVGSVVLVGLIDTVAGVTAGATLVGLMFYLVSWD